MHKFHKKFNSKNSIILRDKILFRKQFNDYFNYPYFVLENNNFEELLNWITTNNISHLVCKDPLGVAGNGVSVLNVSYHYDSGKILLDGESAIKKLKKLYQKGVTLYEDFINQHEVLSEIYPNSVNTVRVVTFVTWERKVEIWGALLRMGVDKKVDNFDAGGISAPIDVETGEIIRPAVSKYPFNDNKYMEHPITKNRIVGVKIPFWEDIIKMIESAALILPDVRTVGWDVALTKDGPTLIEGNDNWDKTHFEMTSGIGLNNIIKERLKNSI